MAEAKILIIDDDPDITESMRIVLESRDYSVNIAEDSDKALELMKDTVPDLIILDVMMNTPREGFIFSIELEHNPDYKEIPVLMITSVKEKIGIDFKSVAGDKDWLPVEEFLDKPVKPEELLEKVETLLGK